MTSDSGLSVVCVTVWAGGERQSTHNPHLNLFVEIAAVSVRMLKWVVSVLDYIFFPGVLSHGTLTQYGIFRM